MARPIRVLVVEDLVPLRRMVARQLTAAGHVVVGEAGGVADALNVARALVRDGRAPDVLLLDGHLPDGLGTDVVARLAHVGLPVDTPPPGVVFYTSAPDAIRHALTAATPEGSRPHGEGHEGAPCVLEKPASAAALDRAIRAVAAR